MGIRYTMPLKAYDNRNWRMNIYSESYTGLSTTIKGSEGQSMSLEYSGEVDEHFGVFYKSTLTVNMLYEGNIDINELQNSADREYRIEIQRENVLYWVGYLISDGIEQPLRSDAYPVKVTAICGLDMLADINYTHNNLPGVTGAGSRVPLNYMRQILFAQNNLNVPIPIRWTNNLRNTFFTGQDVFIGGVQWSPRGEGFNQVDVSTGVSLPKKCEYILEGMLSSMQCRIYQALGRWNIRRVPDYFSGTFKYIQVAGNTGTIIPTTATESIIKKIGNGGYPFINEKDLITNIAGIKSAKVTYNSDVRENILPNGNQDLTSLAQVIYWGFFDPTETIVQSNNGSLDGRSGANSELWNFSPTTKYFTMLSQGSTLTTGGLPIDSKKLVKIMNFSFYFSPKNGFPTTVPINGVISSVGINSSITTRPNGTFSNLIISNESGSGNGGVVDVIVSSNVVTSVILKEGGSGYAVNDIFKLPEFGGEDDPFRGKITAVKSIQGTIDFSSNPLQLQIVLNMGSSQLFLNEFGFWVTDPTAVISPAIESMKIDDIARVAFDKFQGVKLPEPTFTPKAGDTCDIKVLFYVKSGQKYSLDNISITIEDSDDVYVNTINNSKNTKEDDRSISISSSFGGYMVSNFMTGWDKSDSECDFTDGDKYTGTLTGVTADVISRCKYKSSKIYNGAINVRGENWSFDEIYIIESLSDRRFMPISAVYNIEKCEVDLIAIETRNDDISRTEKVYGSNDHQLSN